MQGRTVYGLVWEGPYSQSTSPAVDQVCMDCVYLMSSLSLVQDSAIDLYNALAAVTA